MTLQPHRDLATVVRHIRDAFVERSLPGDASIADDPLEHNIEAQRVVAELKGKHWQDVSPHTLGELHQSLFRLSPWGFRFYLPACLIAAAEAPSEAGSVADIVFSFLTPPGRRAPASQVRRFEARMEGLRPEERYAIKLWLEYMILTDADSFGERGPLKQLIPYWQLDADAIE